MDLAGRYRLTISAASECGNSLPANARRRTYTAEVTQTGSRTEVALTEATFALSRSGKGNKFRGQVTPSEVTFSLTAYDFVNYYYYGASYYPDLVEQVDDGYLIISGKATVMPSGGGLSGNLNGSFLLYGRPLTQYQSATASCSSSAHQFVLSK